MNPNPLERLTIEQVMIDPWMLAFCPKNYPLKISTAKVDDTALRKMSASFNFDKKFIQSMIDSLFQGQKNWLTAK